MGNRTGRRRGRMRKSRRSKVSGQRAGARRWALLAIGALVFGTGLSVVVSSPASATTLQVTVLPPHDGQVSSSPDPPAHLTSYTGDYAFDITGTGDAFARFRNPNGAL